MEDLGQTEFPQVGAEGGLAEAVKPPFSYVLTQTKIYECPARECQHDFTTKKLLNDHKVAVHSFVRCTMPRCARVFTNPRRLDQHLARCHQGRSASHCGPTDIEAGKKAAEEAGDRQLVQELEEETMEYLGGVRGIAMKKGKTSSKRMQKLMSFMVRDLGSHTSSSPGMTLSFLLHAIDVALGLPSCPMPSIFPTAAPALLPISIPITVPQSVPVPPPSVPTPPPADPIPPPPKAIKHRKRRRSSIEPPLFAATSITSEEVLNMVPPTGKRRGPKPSEHECGKCGKVFPYKKELTAHRYVEHPGKRRSSAHFEVQSLPLVTPEVPTQDGSYSCIDSECRQTYKTEGELLSHIRTSHEF